MAIVIEKVELSKNPVQTGQQLIISVTIVTHQYLSHFTNKQLAAYTHKQLKARGTI